MADILEVQFVCHSLPRSGSPAPACQRLGIQEGKEVVQDVLFDGQAEVRFAFSVQVVADPASGAVVFKGKYVQGPRSDPFIYLCWGDRLEVGGWEAVGRSKIPLGTVPNLQIQQALQEGALRARIGLSDRRGNPAFATLKADHVEWAASA